MYTNCKHTHTLRARHRGDIVSHALDHIHSSQHTTCLKVHASTLAVTAFQLCFITINHKDFLFSNDQTDKRCIVYQGIVVITQRFFSIVLVCCI